MLTETDMMLLERGYKQFKPGPLDNEGIETKFQKRFDDERGKKYFITVSKWGEVFPPSYEYEIYLTDKDTECPVNIQFFAGWKVQDVEKRAEELFRTGLWRHYETWKDE